MNSKREMGVFLSIKDVSVYLSIRVSTLYSWCNKGLIPHYKVHGLLRFKKDEIDVWMTTFHKEEPPTPLPSFKRQDHSDIDYIIERVKKEAYNLPHGRPDRIRAGKDGD